MNSVRFTAWSICSQGHVPIGVWFRAGSRGLWSEVKACAAIKLKAGIQEVMCGQGQPSTTVH